MIGKSFGRLTVTALIKGVGGHDGQQRIEGKAICRCDCGISDFIVSRNRLHNGQTRSCGCLRREMTSKRGQSRRTHGESSHAGNTAEYRAWHSMIQRCTNPNNEAWSNYGGRGIKVFGLWRRDFHAFLRDVGRRPHPLLSIDRINNDGNYEPGNVRWATKSEQTKNRRSNALKVSQYKGVGWDNRRKKWRARIKVATTDRHLGQFDSERDAAFAYDVAARFYFGEVAVLNNVNGHD